MVARIFFYSIIVLTFLLLAHSCPHDDSSAVQGPILIDAETLEQNKRLIDQNDTILVQAKNLLLESAERAMGGDGYSVTYKDKDQIPAGATAHDYVSLAPYMWPDPSKKDGLPFIQRDGRRNPLAATYNDNAMLNGVSQDVLVLGLAYLLTREEKYADRAATLLRTFFIDRETRMNPHFNYSQIVLGKDRSGGNIIAGNALLRIVDGIQMIKSSPHWTKRDHGQMIRWFSALLEWMRTSPKGMVEARRTNNIGTFYTVQATTYALFIGDSVLAKDIIEERAYAHIDSQIDQDGKMPLELKRATPWNYVIYNLDAFNMLMRVSRHVGIDLWDYIGDNGGSIRKSYRWVESFLDRKENSFSFYGQNIDKGSVNKFLQKNPPRDLMKPSDERRGRRSETVNGSNYIDILTK